jgi:hypothetical protein
LRVPDEVQNVAPLTCPDCGQLQQDVTNAVLIQNIAWDTFQEQAFDFSDLDASVSYLCIADLVRVGVDVATAWQAWPSIKPDPSWATALNSLIGLGASIYSVVQAAETAATPTGLVGLLNSALGTVNSAHDYAIQLSLALEQKLQGAVNDPTLFRQITGYIGTVTAGISAVIDAVQLVQDVLDNVGSVDSAYQEADFWYQKYVSRASAAKLLNQSYLDCQENCGNPDQQQPQPGGPGGTPPGGDAPQPSPPDQGGPGVGIQPVNSQDPNAMLGPAGYGREGFVALAGPFPYRIDFENDPTATAPAQRVDITDQLDPNLDMTTLQLTEVGFADTVLEIPPGSQYFATSVAVTENGQTFDVDIELGLNVATGQVYAHLYSIDPTTQLPPDVLTGFLPPEDGTGRGMGFFSYIIDPKSGLPTGTQIRNVALLSFDQQPWIATDQVDDHDPTKGVDQTKQDLVTIDSLPPMSSVGPLAATEASTSFPVTWSGQDDRGGSGIAFYNIYVSDNGGPFALWQSDTTATSATFTGVIGHAYGFYSVATDNVGNVEATPAAAQATTKVLLTAPPAQPAKPVLVPADDSGTKGDDVTDDPLPAFSGATQAGATVQLLIGAGVVGTTTAGAGGNYVVAVQKALGPGSYQLKVVASNSGRSSPASNPLSLMIVAPPSTPSAPSLLAADSNGSPDGETTYLASPHLTGDATAGSTVQLLDMRGTILNTTKANGAGTYEVQVPGPLAVGAYSFLVGVIDQYGDVSSPSAAQTIYVATPPAPIVEGTALTTKKGSIQSITVYFSEAMAASSADNSQNYSVVDAGKTHVFGGKGNTNVVVKTAIYSPSNDSVAITLAKRVRTRDSIRLTINAQPPTGLEAANGQFLNEASNGAPGQNAVIYLGAPPKKPPPPKPPKKKVTKSGALHLADRSARKVDFLATNAGRPLAIPSRDRVIKVDAQRSHSNAAPTAAEAEAAIDAVLGRGDLVGLAPFHRYKRVRGQSGNR